MKPAMIESVRIHGFRSLGDVELSRLPRATVLIGANGSGKSNFLRFLYMLNWMKGRRLGDLVERHGGADDYLYDGSEVTPSIDAAIGLRTNVGLSEYRFVLSHAQPDRFFFSKEAFRFVGATSSPDAPWQCLGSAHRESMIVEAAQSDRIEHEERDAARTIVSALKDLAPNQFNDIFTGLRKSIDIDDNTHLHIHGGNLAAILYRLEQEDVKRYDLICRQIGRILPIFDRFAIEAEQYRVWLDSFSTGELWQKNLLGGRP